MPLRITRQFQSWNVTREGPMTTILQGNRGPFRVNRLFTQLRRDGGGLGWNLNRVTVSGPASPDYGSDARSYLSWEDGDNETRDELFDRLPLELIAYIDETRSLALHDIPWGVR